jgi:hypothetical protein
MRQQPSDASGLVRPSSCIGIAALLVVMHSLRSVRWLLQH